MSSLDGRNSGARTSVSRGRRDLLVNLCLLVLSTLLGLGAVEGLARGFYEKPWYESLSQEQANNETLDYRLNNFGLRDDAITVPRPEGELRVYMAGDSFTFGMGVADDGLVMPSLVQQALNQPEKGFAGPVEVLNAGMLRGSLPRHWLGKWNQVAETFDPDVLTIVFFLRDGTATGSIPAFFQVIRERITSRNARDPWYRLSYMYRMYRDRQDRILVADEYTQDFQRAYFGDQNEQKEWRSAQYNVLEMKKAAEARGAKVGFVIYPILVDLRRSDYPFQEICDLLESFAAEHGMPVLNLLPSFRGHRGSDLWVSALDQHPNAEGHRIAAEAITPFVTDLLRQSQEP